MNGFPTQNGTSMATQKVSKGGEAQDENKIFNDDGVHVGNWVNGKKVLFDKKDLSRAVPSKRGGVVSKSIAKQSVFPDGPKAIARKKKRQDQRREVLADPNTSLKDWKLARRSFVGAGGKGFGS